MVVRSVTPASHVCTIYAITYKLPYIKMMFLYLMCLQESLSSTVKIWPKASRRALLTPYLIMLEHCGTLIKMFLPREMTLSGLNRILADVYFGVS